MNTTAAPTPWQVSTTSVLDAEGKLVCVIAGRHLLRPEITATIAAAPEMREALADLIRSVSHPDGEDWPELAKARAMLNRVGGAP